MAIKLLNISYTLVIIVCQEKAQDQYLNYITLILYNIAPNNIQNTNSRFWLNYSLSTLA